MRANVQIEREDGGWWEDGTLNCKGVPKDLVDRKLNWQWRQGWLEPGFGQESCLEALPPPAAAPYSRPHPCPQPRDSPLQPVCDASEHCDQGEAEVEFWPRYSVCDSEDVIWPL